MILVTGGTGFVGGHLLDLLSARGVPARALVRGKAGQRQLPPGVEPAPGDLTSGRGLEEALRGVDTVIHLAGVTRALSAPEFYAGNAAATETLVRALAGRDIRLVHVSSLAAVGPSPDGTPLDEDAPPHPVSIYGKSKLEGERIARSLGSSAAIVRPPVVYGPRDRDVFQILKSVARGVVLEIGGGERWFSAIYVEDLALGLMAVAESPQSGRGVYFLSHPKPVTWSELGATAARIMGRSARTLRVPVPAARAVGFLGEIWSRLTQNPAIISREKVMEACCRFWTCNAGRAAAELGFEAPTPLSSGLARTLVWYKEAGWLKW